MTVVTTVRRNTAVHRAGMKISAVNRTAPALQICWELYSEAGRRQVPAPEVITDDRRNTAEHAEMNSRRAAGLRRDSVILSVPYWEEELHPVPVRQVAGTVSSQETADLILSSRTAAVMTVRVWMICFQQVSICWAR